MKLVLLVIMTTFTLSSYGKFTPSFIVELTDQKIKVTSPLKKAQFVSIIIQNKTLEKIIAELKSENKVIKRFTVQAESKQVFQVDFSKLKKLYFVPIAPPFEAAELAFMQRPYEIPEKN